MAPSFRDEDSLFNFVVKEGNGVKGLVDLGLTKVPDRYIQPTHHRINKQHAIGTLEILTIDLSELDGPNHEEVVKDISHASETLGFFQVVNHGVPLELLESLKVAAHKFFEQPTEKKAVYLKGVGKNPLVSYGTSGFDPENDHKALEWKDFVSLVYTNDADARQFWPDDCKEVVLELIKTSSEMVQKLLKALINNLGVKLDDSRYHELTDFRMVNLNLYPACPNPELTVGVERHSDASMLTVLLQDDIGGLYVRKDELSSPENEVWVEIPPVHGALVINVGDALQILSNGKYKSVEHKVRTTNIESRVSVPLFIAPLPATKIGPFPEVLAQDGVARYKKIVYGEYLRNYLKKALDGKMPLDFALLDQDGK